MNTRLYRLIILVLFSLNIALIAGILFKNNRPKHPPKLSYFLETELNLSVEQKTEYRRMRIAHFRERDQNHREMQQLKDDFFSNMGKNLSSEEISVLADKISEKYVEMDISTFKHFSKLRSICNEEQKLKFDEVIRVALHRRGPPPRRGRP